MGDETWDAEDDVLLRFHARGRSHPAAIAVRLFQGVVFGGLPPDELAGMVTERSRAGWDWDQVRAFISAVPDPAISSEGVRVGGARDVATVRILADEPELRIGTGGPGATVQVVAWLVVIWQGVDVGWLVHMMATEPVPAEILGVVPRPSPESAPDW